MHFRRGRQSVGKWVLACRGGQRRALEGLGLGGRGTEAKPGGPNPAETTQGMTQSEQQVQQTGNKLEMQRARPKALTDWMKCGVWAAS